MAAKPRVFTGAELKINLLKHTATINEPNNYKINSFTEATVSALQRQTCQYHSKRQILFIMKVILYVNKYFTKNADFLVLKEVARIIISHRRRHHHHHHLLLLLLLLLLLPWIRSFDLFRHRRIAIVS